MDSVTEREVLLKLLNKALPNLDDGMNFDIEYSDAELEAMIIEAIQYQARALQGEMF